MFRRRGIALLASLLVAVGLTTTACSSQDRDGGDGTGPVPITLWTHSAGNEARCR